MSRKIMILAVVLTLLAVSIIVVKKESSSTNTKQMKTNLINEYDLDILAQLGNYNAIEYDDKKLLEVAMKIAEKRNILEKHSGDDASYMFVPKEDLHNLIFELTGIMYEAPITCEENYLYDSENEYYYCKNLIDSNVNIVNINSFSENAKKLNIKCLVERLSGDSAYSESSILENQELLINLTKNPDNSLIKYTLISIKEASN